MKDLLDVLAEMQETPPPCQHVFAVHSWSLERDTKSPYYGCWVHDDPDCRRSAHMEKQL